jgi:thiol-disulfide isomerase/thioredoxin
MKARVLSLFGVLASLAAVSPASPAEEMTPERWMKINEVHQRASGHYQKKDYPKAIESYREVLTLIPSDPAYDRMRLQSHFFIATGYARLGQKEEAIDHLEKAVEHGFADPTDLERRPDFISLRGSPRYSGLLEKMRRKAEEERQKVEVQKTRRTAALKGFDFTLRSVDGKTISKKDYLGQVLIVDIWGTWCPPCRMEIPHFLELEKRYGAQGLRIVGLNAEKTPDRQQAERLVKNALSSLKITYPCAIATEEILRSVPDLRGYPTTLFFGRDGSPRAIEVGYKELAALEAIVKPLLAEPAPQKAAEAGNPAK